MKKITMALIGIVLVSTLVSAVVLDNRTQARAWFNNMKPTYEQNLIDRTSSITYIEPHMCKMNYTTEKFDCYTCFRFRHRQERFKDCIPVPQNTTLAEIDNIVLNHSRGMIMNRYPPGDAEFIKRDIKNREIEPNFP